MRKIVFLMGSFIVFLICAAILLYMKPRGSSEFGKVVEEPLKQLPSATNPSTSSSMPPTSE